MKRSFYLAGLVLALAGLAGCAQEKAVNSGTEGEHLSGIIGGEEVKPGDDLSKSIVSILNMAQGSLCTGSILSNEFIVTAAHCVDTAEASELKLVFGVNIHGIGNEEREVANYAVAPIWAARQNEEFDTGDIALIRFEGGLPKGYKKSRMMKNMSPLQDGTGVLLAGYGISDGRRHTGAGVLRQVRVQVAKTKYSKSEVLLEQTKGKGACHGDSGGPAYVELNGERLLWGVTSRGVNDPNNDCSRFAAYTNILAYARWLGEAARDLKKAPPAARNGRGETFRPRKPPRKLRPNYWGEEQRA